jgi:glycosyltransferase involved in cell wall biosynthesis
MRIGIDIRAFKNGQTGIAKYLRNLMDCLQTIDTTNEYFLFEPRDIPYNIHNAKWQKICIPTRMPGILWQQFIIPFYLKKHHIDIFWAPEQIAPVYSGGAKIVTTVHDLVVYRFPDSCQKSNLYIQKCLLPLTLRRSSAILPVSNYIKNELLTKFSFLDGSNISVITNAGPEWSVPSNYSPKNRQNFLLCVGNIEPRKNLIRLIKAFEKIDDNDLQLVIVGPEGWKNSEFYSVIEYSPKKSKIVIKGFVSEEELKTLYVTCKALVYPSIYEGFGIPVLEAFSMDCPVLTSGNSAMEEIAGECAIYFDPWDIDSIAEKIRLFLAAPEYGIKFGNSYSWSKSAAMLLKVFESFRFK